MIAVTDRQAAPAPILCVVDHQHRDPALAEDALRGRFTHGGDTLTLALPPDWIRDGLPGDEEWRIEWVKLYEGLDLAHAFAGSGDARYLHTWEVLVSSFCDQVPVGHDTSDVSARRVQNWLYAWSRFAAAPGFPGLREGLAERLAARIAADCAHLGAHLTRERNHRTLELYTLLVAALAFGPDLVAASQALSLLAENAERDIWVDGVHRECATDYHLIVMRSLVGAVANARAAGLAVPPALLDATGRAADFALHIQRPDGMTPAFSDGDQGDFRALLALAATVLDRPELRWAATGGETGQPPQSRLVSFPVGGYHVQRSGWGEGATAYADERFALFDCGPVGDGGHGHYDALSVEVAGGGTLLALDPGRYTYAEEPIDTGGVTNWRHWFKGTAAHNTVTVDRLDQTPYRRGRPKGPVATARLLGRSTRAGLDVLAGEVRSPCHDAVHTRWLAFVAEDYWIVHDRLRAPTPHRYEARWHLAPSAHGQVKIERSRGQVTVHAPGLVLAVPAGWGQVGLEDGWVSPTYGVRLPAPVVVLTAEATADADLLTVLIPDPTGELGRTGISVAAATGEHGATVRVAQPANGVDPLTVDIVTWDGPAAWVRRSS